MSKFREHLTSLMENSLTLFWLGLMIGFGFFWYLTVNTTIIDAEHTEQECVTATVFDETKDFCREKEL